MKETSSNIHTYFIHEYIKEVYDQTHADSPEWEVAEGQEVSVPLQPETSHMLQVTGGGNAAPYLLDSSSSSKSLITISPNTSLTIVTWRHNSVTEVEVSQIGTEVSAHRSCRQLTSEAHEIVTQ